jgi:hypothetical protein
VTPIDPEQPNTRAKFQISAVLLDDGDASEPAVLPTYVRERVMPHSPLISPLLCYDLFEFNAPTHTRASSKLPAIASPKS